MVENIRKVKTVKTIYELPSSGKFNVILGKNASGKSTFSSLVGLDHMDSDRQKIYVVNNNYLFNAACNDDGSSLWVIDEEMLFELDSSSIDRLVKSKSQFVIISRTVPENLPISYKDIFRLSMSNRYYKLHRVYKDYDTFVKSESYVIEGGEGKSEHEYCAKWLGNVLPAGGNSKAVKHKDKDCIILDGAACGGLMTEVELFKNIYLPISFEERIYSSLFRRASVDEYWWKSYASLERYYTMRLIKDAKEIGINYSKGGNLNKKILSLDIYGINDMLKNAVNLMSST